MKKIYEPFHMNNIDMKNRLVRSATWEGIANQDGSVTEAAYDIYRELAKGGVGAIITGFTSVALNNVHTSHDGDFSQAEQITHSGALLVGTYDNFTDGDPVEFLKNLNRHMPAADQNDLIFIEKTGHTYQMKNQEVADLILSQIRKWKQ